MMKKVLITHYKTKEVIEVDSPIASLIEVLNQNSFFYTLYSCAGHNKEQFYVTFKYNIDTSVFLNKVFDYIQENYKGPIKIGIDINILDYGQKCITIRSNTPQGFYCNLNENDKYEFCATLIKGFSYWLYTLNHNQILYNSK